MFFKSFNRFFCDYVDINKEKKRQVFELDTDQLRAMIEILQEAHEEACECQKKIE